MIYLTATLPPHEEDEWMEIMKIRKEEAQIFRASTTRPNIAYSVMEYPVDEEGQVEAACQLVRTKIEEYPAPAKIIVYSSSIPTTTRLGTGLDCHMYYRDVGDIHVKEEIRRAWESADGRVVVATNAFGLGIDRPDVRVVIHVGPVFQIRNYVQESGRAGRDQQPSEAIIMVPEGRQEALQKRFEKALYKISYLWS
ncbi:P-loop containing nucleoside triphosphate hydrolase protein [Xylogone sp. PMI_703]|nr:P-loop containing nucleoside triphosphate hydrolase protein [Xylogone sp. PMI_703]